MAEKKSNISYDSILKDIKAGTFAPVYILMGEESYFIDKLCDSISENALREDERDFNQTVVFGSDVSSGQIADIARRFPMMAERQVVIVKEAQNIHNWERIEKYIEKPQPTTVLVICHKNGSINAKKKVLTLAAACGVVFESKKKTDRELPVFIENYLKERATTIDSKSIQMIVEHIGADLSRLSSELDKVILSLPKDAKIITPEIVEQQIGVSKEYNGFEFRSAIANKNISKANSILKYFDNNPKSGGGYILLPMLFSYFQNLMIAHYSPKKGRDEDIAAWLELKSAWAARDYTTGMRNYSALKTMQIIDKIREVDAKSKGLDNPSTTMGELMRELVFFILH